MLDFNYRNVALMLAIATMVSGCDLRPKSGYGFTLPEGDIAAGEEAFKRFQCSDCHAVADREDLREGIDPILTVPLGGKSPKIQTYGQLVTSVINPSHKISQKYLKDVIVEDGISPMRNYNDIMTVTEMANIVMFLQEQYELEPYTPTHYYHFSLPL